MPHTSAFLNLVEGVMPRIKEISVEEVAARLFLSPHRGEAGRGAGLGNADANNLPANRGCPPPNLPPTGGGIILIDVREKSEWAHGHAAGAVHIGKGVIERDIERIVPDKNTPLVLYCGGGYRSALAADAIQNMGYTNVYSLAEGWGGWCARGLPRE